MLSEGLLISGLVIIFATDSNMSPSLEMIHNLKSLNAGFYKAPFWAHYCFWYVLMILQMFFFSFIYDSAC